METEEVPFPEEDGDVLEETEALELPEFLEEDSSGSSMELEFSSIVELLSSSESIASEEEDSSEEPLELSWEDEEEGRKTSPSQ